MNAFSDSLTHLTEPFIDCLIQQALYLVPKLQSLREHISKSTQSFIHSYLHKFIQLTSTHVPITVPGSGHINK